MGVAVRCSNYGQGTRARNLGRQSSIRDYGEREIYTRWVLQAERWKAREAEWGKKLFFETGQLSLAREWTKDLTDTRKVFDKLGVKYDVVQHDDLLRRYPQMNMQNVDFAMHTPSTGVLKAREGCVAVAQAFAKKGGRFLIAKVDLGRRSGTTLQDVVLSTGQRVAAQTFVFACGPWLPKVFPAVMKNKLASPRRVVFFMARRRATNASSELSTWSVDSMRVPSIEGKGFRWSRPRASPRRSIRRNTLTAEELRKGREFVARVSGSRQSAAGQQSVPARGQRRRRFSSSTSTRS
jgi:hypothetical protein